MSNGRAVRTLGGHVDSVISVSFSPDGKFALSGSWDTTVRLWNVSTGMLVRTLKGHINDVTAVTFSPDGKFALTGSSDKTIKLWDVRTGTSIKTFSGHSDEVKAVSFSPDGRFALSGSKDKTARLWDVAAGVETRRFLGHGGVNAVVFSPDGKYALIGGRNDDYTPLLKLWNVSTGNEMQSFKGKGHENGISSVSFSPDGRYALSGSFDHTIKLWDLSTGEELRTFRGQASGVSSVSFSPDGRNVLSATYASKIVLWDIVAGKEVRKLKGYKYSITGHRYEAMLSAYFSPDGRYALSASSLAPKIWDISTGEETRIFLGLKSYVEAVAFSPDGKYVLTGGRLDDPTLKLWDVSTGNEVKTLKGHSNHISSAVFSPDGRFALSGSHDKTLKLWDVSTGREIRTFQGHSDGVYSAAFSPDGRFVLSGSGDNTLKLWDVSSGKEVRTFKGHAGIVRSVSFSPDGRHVFSGSFDGTARIWDISTGKVIRTLKVKGSADFVLSVAYGPDGRYALTGGGGASIIWNAATGSELCRMITFDDGEWIVITPEGYFNASPNGAKNLNVRIGNNVYSIDQFYARFYRPELVQLALAGKEVPKGETFGDILVKKPAPAVWIVSPVAGEIIDKDSITVSLKIIDNGGGIGNVNIYLNGAQVANETRGVIVKGRETANEKLLSFTIPLIEGQNEIRAVAFNKENSMESNPAKISVISKALLRKPDLYALVIGINEYKNKSISLTYAVPDAAAFAETLKKTAAPLFEKTDIRILTTPDATTKEAITKAFEELRLKIKPNDLFVFYDASHGVVDVVNNEEQYFLLTSNVLLLSSRHIGEDAMGQKDLAKLIGNIPAQKKVVILDTCNAGKGGKELQIALLQQTRGLTESTAVKLLQRAIGSAVFSASSDTQQALEGYKGHGLFTYVLMEGLRGKADIKKDGFITVLGLADYVEEQVTKLSEEVFKRQQTPTIQTGANFPIGKVQ
ncbi:MAG: caspase family protein [Nitrospirota bacterium]